MSLSFYLYLYRYYLFAITIISNAVICSAAASNLPIAKNTTSLHTQVQVDTYMIFLSAFSLLLVIPMVFIDVFSQRAITGRVWVESLWVDFLWLLHLIGAIFVTSFLPHAMCTPQAKSINGNSCISAKLILIFSWICTINLFIYLVTLVGSAMLHFKQDFTVWSAQVRSYPWYSNCPCSKLGSRPNSPPPRHHHRHQQQVPVPISAPQPRRPIQFPARALLSFVPPKAEQMPVLSRDPENPPSDRRVSLQAMQQTSSARVTLLYPLHIQAVWSPSNTAGGLDSAPLSSGTAQSQVPLRSPPATATTSLQDGGPPPLWNWPRPDIMSMPPPPRKKAVAVPSASAPASTQRPSGRGRGRSSRRTLKLASPV